MLRRDLLRLTPPLRCALVLVLALVPVGCGGGDDEQPPPALRGSTLTIYSSLPQQGPLSGVAADVLGAQQLALDQQGRRIGDYGLRLVALDAATPEEADADPSKISENARRAARNQTTVAYLGELASGTSAISIPLLNEAGILEVSPLDGAMALTGGSSAVTGSPDRFYPKQQELGRTFARVVPSDESQADALLDYMRDEGVERLAVLTDDDPSGLALATLLRAHAREAGIAIVAREQVDVHARRHDELIERVALERPDAVLDAGGAREGVARMWRELLVRDPRLLLFAPASFATDAFAASLGTAVAAAARFTRPVAARREAPAAALRFERAFAARYGHAPAPEALYGYEAMRGVLAAIARAERAAPNGLVTRAAVVKEYFATDGADGVLGPYAIEDDGDTTLRRWGAFRVAHGRLTFVRTLVDSGWDARSAEG